MRKVIEVMELFIKCIVPKSYGVPGVILHADNLSPAFIVKMHPQIYYSPISHLTCENPQVTFDVVKRSAYCVDYVVSFGSTQHIDFFFVILVHLASENQILYKSAARDNLLCCFFYFLAPYASQRRTFGILLDSFADVITFGINIGGDKRGFLFNTDLLELCCFKG